MRNRSPTLDEAILATLTDLGLLSTAAIAGRLAVGDRTVRRRLHHLIAAGYAFSPAYGRYRITAAGLAVMAPTLRPDRILDTTPAQLLERWRRDQR